MTSMRLLNDFLKKAILVFPAPEKFHFTIVKSLILLSWILRYHTKNAVINVKIGTNVQINATSRHEKNDPSKKIIKFPRVVDILPIANNIPRIDGSLFILKSKTKLKSIYNIYQSTISHSPYFTAISQTWCEH